MFEIVKLEEDGRQPCYRAMLGEEVFAQPGQWFMTPDAAIAKAKNTIRIRNAPKTNREVLDRLDDLLWEIHKTMGDQSAAYLAVYAACDAIREAA